LLPQIGLFYLAIYFIALLFFKYAGSYITPSSDAQKVAFVLCKNEAQRNAQNKGRFLGQLQRLVMFFLLVYSGYRPFL
jgi:hypothetical protein